MARLRFPGRPGHRYGRSLVRYLPDRDKTFQNVFFARTAAIQRNLKWFYDIFGDSDEEDDFPGFTWSEIGIPPLRIEEGKDEEVDPNLSPKIKNVKAAWPIMGRRAGRYDNYTKGERCAEMERGEWNTANPYKRKRKRVADGRIQKVKPTGKGGEERKRRLGGRLSYRDMIKGVDVRPKLIPPKSILPKSQTSLSTKIGGKIRMAFQLPKHKAPAAISGKTLSPEKPTKMKIKLLSGGAKAKILKPGGKPTKEELQYQKALETVAASQKCPGKFGPWGRVRLERAQQLLKKARTKKIETLPIKFKPWQKKKFLQAQEQSEMEQVDSGAGVKSKKRPEKVGKVCVPKSKQVNLSHAKELLKRVREAQKKGMQDFGSDTPGKRSVKCSSKLADMDVKGVDLHFLHRTVSPPPKYKVFQNPSTVSAKKLQLTDNKSRTSLETKVLKTPKPKTHFVLPTVSSRSSRVIKPTKRFIEEENFGPSSILSPPSSHDDSKWSDVSFDQDESVAPPVKQEHEFEDLFNSPDAVILDRIASMKPDELAKLSSSIPEQKAKEKKAKKPLRGLTIVKGEGKSPKKSPRKSASKKAKEDTDKENVDWSSAGTPPKRVNSAKELRRISVKVKNGVPLSEAEETNLLTTDNAAWLSLQALYKHVVKKDKLSETEWTSLHKSPLVLFHSLHEGGEIMHVRGRIDGLPSVVEILEKIKAGEEITPGEEEKYKRYKLICRSRQYESRRQQREEKEKLRKKKQSKKEDRAEEGVNSSAGDEVIGSDSSPSGKSKKIKKKKKVRVLDEVLRKPETLREKRERYLKNFLEAKEKLDKVRSEHADVIADGDLPSLRALYRKKKQGLEFTPEEADKYRKGKVLTHHREHATRWKMLLKKSYKGSGDQDKVEEGEEDESQEVAAKAGEEEDNRISVETRRLLALGSKMFAEHTFTSIPKLKVRKKVKVEKVLSGDGGEKKKKKKPLKSKLSKAQRLKLKKKKRKKWKGDGVGLGELVMAHKASKSLSEGKSRKKIGTKGKVKKVKKKAKAASGEERDIAASKMKSPLHNLQDKLMSPSDKNIHDTVSRQMADALEADMSPDQDEGSKVNAQQVGNEVTIETGGSVSRGPRIKHVCRRASVALGYSPARFEAPPTPVTQLSALPVQERKKLFTSDGEESGPEDATNKTSPRHSGRKRKKRSMEDYITPVDELAMADGGRRGKDSEFRLKTKSKIAKAKNKMAAKAALLSYMEAKTDVKRRTRCGQCAACLRKNDCKTCLNCLDKPKYGGRGTKKQACIHRKCHNLQKMKLIRLKQMREQLQKDQELLTLKEPKPKPRPMAPPAPPKPTVPKPAGARIKRAGGDVPKGIPLVARTEDKTEKPDGAASQLRPVKFSKTIPSKHLIKTDFKDDYSMSIAWKRGMAIISSEPMVPRTVCYLCGSSGKHELMYCNVCCEPYHEFCLEDDERPLPGETENWCCKNCRFCHVCDHQDKLLTCKKCHCSYHAECLGPNYPTKPSKKRKIWVCSRCVKCKSCGATTPGADPKAQWMHDFSHCQECGKLFEKGNYCPVCKKCYEDDDFESKMMQCIDCCRWVHSKCENLSDDEYRILTELPDSVPYRCPVCARNKESPWRQEVSEELQAGFVNVLNAMYACKSAGHLIWPNRRFKYLRKVQPSASSSNQDNGRDSASSPAPSEDSSSPTPDASASDAQDDVEETYSFRRGRTVRRVLRRRRQQRTAGKGDASGKEEEVAKTAEKEEGVRTGTQETEGEDVRVEDIKVEDAEVIVGEMPDVEKDSRVEGDADRICGEVPQEVSVEAIASEECHPEDSGVAEPSAMDTDCKQASDSVSVQDVFRTSRDDSATETGTAQERISAEICVASQGNDSEPHRTTVLPNSESGSGTSEKDMSVETRATDQAEQTRTSPESSMEAQISNQGNSGISESVLGKDPLVAQSAAAGEEDNLTGESGQSLVESNSEASEDVNKDNSPMERIGSSESSLNSGLTESTESSGTLESATASGANESIGISDVNVDQSTPTGRGGELRGAKESTESLSEDRVGSSGDKGVDVSMESIVNVEEEMDVDVEGLDASSAEEKRESETSGTTLKSEVTGIPPSAGDEPVGQVVSVTGTTPAESEDSKMPVQSTSPVPEAAMEITASSPSQTDQSTMALVPKSVSIVETPEKEEKKEKTEEEMRPSSLQFVRAKMMAGFYKSVEKFCKDCLSIFQASVQQESSQTPGLVRSNRQARETFTQIMTRMFPWFSFDESKPAPWNKEETFKKSASQVAIQPPHMDHEYAQFRHRVTLPQISTQPSPFKKLPTPRRRHHIIGGDGSVEDVAMATDDMSDPRRCCLCGQMGDDDPNNAGRLLYCGQAEWIHINCGLWSAEVFEEMDGSLINVHAAISRGRMLRCEVCSNLGATVGCCSRGCPANFHFMCARSRNAMFQEDKKVYCAQHADKVDKALMGPDSFGVLRRVCVSLDSMKPNRTFSQGLEAKAINAMIGSWTLESLGHLGLLSDTEEGLFPLEFSCTRVFWSTFDACRRCVYTMRIIEVNPLASPTTPKEINHTTEHSPGWIRKPMDDVDDTDLLTDALMEATKESSEAAMALDQVAALLAGSQTVSEIQCAADALAANSSLFELPGTDDEGVLDSLNLDENLNSGLDSDGILDMVDAVVADLNLNPEMTPDGTHLPQNPDLAPNQGLDHSQGQGLTQGQELVQDQGLSEKQDLMSNQNLIGQDTDPSINVEVDPQTSGPSQDAAVTASPDQENSTQAEHPTTLLENASENLLDSSSGKSTDPLPSSPPTLYVSIPDTSAIRMPTSPIISPKKVPRVKLTRLSFGEQESPSKSSSSANGSKSAEPSVTESCDTQCTDPDLPNNNKVEESRSEFMESAGDEQVEDSKDQVEVEAESRQGDKDNGERQEHLPEARPVVVESALEESVPTDNVQVESSVPVESLMTATEEMDSIPVTPAISAVADQETHEQIIRVKANLDNSQSAPSAGMDEKTTPTQELEGAASSNNVESDQIKESFQTTAQEPPGEDETSGPPTTLPTTVTNVDALAEDKTISSPQANLMQESAAKTFRENAPDSLEDVSLSKETSIQDMCNTDTETPIKIAKDLEIKDHQGLSVQQVSSPGTVSSSDGDNETGMEDDHCSDVSSQGGFQPLEGEAFPEDFCIKETSASGNLASQADNSRVETRNEAADSHDPGQSDVDGGETVHITSETDKIVKDNKNELVGTGMTAETEDCRTLPEVLEPSSYAVDEVSVAVLTPEAISESKRPELVEDEDMSEIPEQKPEQDSKCMQDTTPPAAVTASENVDQAEEDPQNDIVPVPQDAVELSVPSEEVIFDSVEQGQDQVDFVKVQDQCETASPLPQTSGTIGDPAVQCETTSPLPQTSDSITEQSTLGDDHAVADACEAAESFLQGAIEAVTNAACTEDIPFVSHQSDSPVEKSDLAIEGNKIIISPDDRVNEMSTDEHLQVPDDRVDEMSSDEHSQVLTTIPRESLSPETQTGGCIGKAMSSLVSSGQIAIDPSEKTTPLEVLPPASDKVENNDKTMLQLATEDGTQLDQESTSHSSEGCEYTAQEQIKERNSVDEDVHSAGLSFLQEENESSDLCTPSEDLITVSVHAEGDTIEAVGEVTSVQPCPDQVKEQDTALQGSDVVDAHSGRKEEQDMDECTEPLTSVAAEKDIDAHQRIESVESTEPIDVVTAITPEDVSSTCTADTTTEIPPPAVDSNAQTPVQESEQTVPDDSAFESQKMGQSGELASQNVDFDNQTRDEIGLVEDKSLHFVDSDGFAPVIIQLTEEQRMQGVREEDIRAILSLSSQGMVMENGTCDLSPLQSSAKAGYLADPKELITKEMLVKEDSDSGRRLSSDPEHKSILQQLSQSLASHMKGPKKITISPSAKEREPILSAFASKLHSGSSAGSSPEEKVPNNDVDTRAASPLPKKNIFKKFESPKKFASVFKAFVDSKKNSRDAANKLIDGNLETESLYAKANKDHKEGIDSTKSSPLSSSNVLCDIHKRKRRRSLRGIDDAAQEDLVNGDDRPVSSLDVIDTSPPGKKKYPMRSTFSRLHRISDVDAEDSLSRAADFDHPLQEKDSEGSTRKRGRPRKSDALLSPNGVKSRDEPLSLDIVRDVDKAVEEINHVDDEHDENEGTGRRTRRKASQKLRDIIAAELEESEDSVEEAVVEDPPKRGRGRPRLSLETSHVTDREAEYSGKKASVEEPLKRGRGRPRLAVKATDETTRVKDLSQDVATEDRPKRGRGRPRKGEQRTPEPSDRTMRSRVNSSDVNVDDEVAEVKGLQDTSEGITEFCDADEKDIGHKRQRDDLSAVPENDSESSDDELSAKRVKHTSDVEETQSVAVKVSKESPERQSHPRKQTVVAREFPGDEILPGEKNQGKKRRLSGSEDVSKEVKVLTGNEKRSKIEDNTVDSHPLKPVSEDVKSSDTTTKEEAVPPEKRKSDSPARRLKVTVQVDPETGDISEVVTAEVESDEGGKSDEEIMDMEDSSTPTNATPVNTSCINNMAQYSSQPAPQSMDINSKNVYGGKRVIGKDLYTNELIYSDPPRAVKLNRGSNALRGPRIRGPTQKPANIVRQLTTSHPRIRGPFSRNQSSTRPGVITLKPSVQTPASGQTGGVPQLLRGLSQRMPMWRPPVVQTTPSPSLTNQSLANRNTYPTQMVVSTSGPVRNVAQGVLQSPQTRTSITSIHTSVPAQPPVSVITTKAVTSTAQDHYLSILQKSYQASQMQSSGVYGNLSQQHLLLPSVGVQSGMSGTPAFFNQGVPMASPTIQTLQALMQQAGVNASVNQSGITPLMQPSVNSQTSFQLNAFNQPPGVLSADSAMVASILSSLSSPTKQQINAELSLSLSTESNSLSSSEHSYSESSKHRRKSPHQVKVWFDSYGSLKNEDDDNDSEGTACGVGDMDLAEDESEKQVSTLSSLPGPSSPVLPAVRVKNPSNMSRARVKNPTYGMEDSKNKVRVSKKRSKSRDEFGGIPLDMFSGLSAEDAFLATMPSMGQQSDHHDDSPSVLLTLMEQERKRGATTTPQRAQRTRPHLVFEIRSDDGFETRADTIDEAWARVVERVGETRTNARMKHLSFDGVKGMKMLGLTHGAIIFLLEQLYGARNCRNYRFRFHKHEDDLEDDEPPINPHGCARAEFYKRTSTFDIFNFLASHHRNRPLFNEAEQEEPDVQHKSSRRATSLQDLPMAMRFRHLKQTAKEAVGVYRSGIHGRGLFCRRPIEAGEMVIEYSGTVIRSILTDKREKYYESKGIGCYMFRIDDHDVVDATTHGNAARFINHSCDPNCFSRVIEIGGQKHIIIFASRRIAKGEELTYDYKFPIEEVKIPCNCGSKKCRKYLN